jgi:hypothetical protein
VEAQPSSIRSTDMMHAMARDPQVEVPLLRAVWCCLCEFFGRRNAQSSLRLPESRR